MSTPFSGLENGVFFFVERHADEPAVSDGRVLLILYRRFLGINSKVSRGSAASFSRPLAERIAAMVV